MSTWWSTRSPRERLLLAIGGGVVAVLLLWAMLWDPLSVSRDRLRAEVQRQAAELSWMRPAALGAARHGHTSIAPADGRSLLARLDAGAREAGLGGSLAAVEPQASGQVAVRLAAADFARFADWLEALAATGLGIDELSVRRAAGGGVDVRVVVIEGAR